MFATATPRNDYLFGEEFVDGLDTPAGRTAEEIRAATHIVNGGEVALPECLRCHGSGQWRGYARTFPCRGCNGTGKATVARNAAVKGKATKEANRAAWMEENLDAVMYATKRRDKGSTFYGKLIEGLDAYGTWTENQTAMIRRDMAKDAAFWEQKKIERAAAAPKVEMAAIEALFATATDNDVKRPVFRAEGLEISKAPLTGRNAGALYVKAEGEYVGKVVGGQFHKVYAAAPEIADRLMAVAADPLGESMKYARRTGNCGLCGRPLVDPVSIRALVGPVCAPKWGLDWRRDEAQAELAREA